MKTFILTGFSGSGKTTLAKGVIKKFNKDSYPFIHLDGDDIRANLNYDLGFSIEDRKENLRRVSGIAKILNNQEFYVMASFIFPTEVARQEARRIIGIDRTSIIYLQCSLETCISRDPKGLYKADTPLMTGVKQLYEYPKNPDFVVDTESFSPEDSINKLFRLIRSII